MGKIIDYIKTMPTVVSVEVDEKPIIDEDVWDKKVRVMFAGYDEPVVMELY
jgi:hypothetical protein